MGTDTVAFWHDNAARTPMLTASQEISLGKTIQEWLKAEDPSPQLIRRGKRAKDRMIQSNLKLVVSICKKYSKRISRTANLEMLDLYQEGVIGLDRAAAKFNPESGYKFSTYAFWWVSQAVKRIIEQQLTTIRCSNAAVQLHMRFLYRPEGQSIEDFAKAEGKSVEWVREYLKRFNRAQVASLNANVNSNPDSDSSLIDFISIDEVDDEEVEYRSILDELRGIDEVKDSLAILELSQEAKVSEIAPLLDCSPQKVRMKLKDYAAQIREHMPADLRARLRGEELNDCGRIDNIKASELPQMPETISSNGHCKSLEAEAIAVIAEVQEADEVEASKPTRRKRRSSAEVAASETVSLKINGMDMEGKAADVAAVLKAYSV